ncbi:hypothetical protein JCM14076_27710 [Methylosoma difficile]
MFDVLKVLFAICLLQKNPQDLPYSPFLLRLLIAGNFAVALLISHLESKLVVALLQALFSVLIAFAFCWLCLYLGKKRHRLNQTLSAFFGVDAMLSFFSLPAIATLVTGHDSLLVVLVLVAMIVWHWAVIGHIIRNALEQNLGFSLGIALLYLMANYKIMAWLFPEVQN